jgi:hypothetical protein
MVIDGGFPCVGDLFAEGSELIRFDRQLSLIYRSFGEGILLGECLRAK